MADSMAPDVGQTLAPDGTVSYNFTGHVKAQGLDLDAATHKDPPTADQVRWLRQSDGALVASLSAYDDPFGSRGLGIVPARELTLKIAGDASTPPPTASLVAEATDLGMSALVDVTSSSDGTIVGATAGTESVTIIDSTGASSFTRPADLTQMVQAIGAPASLVSGNGTLAWSSDVGNGTITTGLSDVYWVGATLVDLGGVFSGVTIIGTDSIVGGVVEFVVQSMDGANYAGSTSDFMWLAYGAP